MLQCDNVVMLPQHSYNVTTTTLHFHHHHHHHHQTERLGAGPGGLAEIQNHPFFKGIDWENLRSTTPPIIPGDVSLDTAFPDVEKASTKTELFPAPRSFVGNQLPFVGYTFSRDAHFFVTCGLPDQTPSSAGALSSLLRQASIKASSTSVLASDGSTASTAQSSDVTLLVHKIEVFLPV